MTEIPSTSNVLRCLVTTRAGHLAKLVGQRYPTQDENSRVVKFEQTFKREI